MTLHDYKLMCPSYLFINKGKVCEACKGNRYYMAILKRCHKSSYAASAIVALESYFCMRLLKYRKNIKTFLSPSRFLKNKMIEYGWPESQIQYLPNFISTSDLVSQSLSGKYFLCLGRLSVEKGIATLINAYRRIQDKDVGLLIAGEGPLRSELERIAGQDSSIKFTGFLSGVQLLGITRNALAVVVPSLCYENAPISVLEAMAYGKPVIGARIGGIPEMIYDGINGFLFKPGDETDLRNVLSKTISLSDEQLEHMGRMGREKTAGEYSPEKHYQQLMSVYLSSMSREGPSCESPMSR